jgi:hypothetical protein
MNEREHAPYHERRLEQQQLDALLRIEEQLFAIGKALTARTVVTGPSEEPEEDEPSVNARGEITPPKQRGKRK